MLEKQNETKHVKYKAHTKYSVHINCYDDDHNYSRS